MPKIIIINIIKNYNINKHSIYIIEKKYKNEKIKNIVRLIFFLRAKLFFTK